MNQLSDFEFIVWGCYVLTADDFGVMRLSGVTLQADHDRLAKKSTSAIERALGRAVDVGLLLKFEHQGRRYVCQHDWQDYQKIRFPSRSTNPLPTPDVLEQCTVATRELFRSRSESSPKPSRGIVKPLTELPHGNANANGNGSENGDGNANARSGLIVDDALAERAGRFVDRFGEFYAKHRHGARWLRRQPALDWDRACRLCLAWDDARLDKLVVIFLESDDEWISKTDRSLAVFESRATWCDERLASAEAKRRA